MTLRITYFSPYCCLQVELVELLSSLDYRVISYLESLCLDVRRGNNHYIGVSEIVSTCFQLDSQRKLDKSDYRHILSLYYILM